MPRRRTGNRKFPKRSTLWVPFETTIALTTAGAVVVASTGLLENYFGQTGEEVPIGSTVGPIRGIWTLEPTTNTAIDQGYRVEAHVQVEAEGGRASPGTPGVDIIDGMWYGQFAYAQAQLLEQSSGVFTAPSLVKDFTTKAKRKITGNGQEVNVSAVGSGNTDYTLAFIGNIMVMLS